MNNTFDHLPGHLRGVSGEFFGLAHTVDNLAEALCRATLKALALPYQK